MDYIADKEYTAHSIFARIIYQDGAQALFGKHLYKYAIKNPQVIIEALTNEEIVPNKTFNDFDESGSIDELTYIVYCILPKIAELIPFADKFDKFFTNTTITYLRGLINSYFVEQQLAILMCDSKISGAAGLEHEEWQTLVQSNTAISGKIKELYRPGETIRILGALVNFDWGKYKKGPTPFDTEPEVAAFAALLRKELQKIQERKDRIRNRIKDLPSKSQKLDNVW